MKRYFSFFSALVHTRTACTRACKKMKYLFFDFDEIECRVEWMLRSIKIEFHSRCFGPCVLLWSSSRFINLKSKSMNEFHIHRPKTHAGGHTTTTATVDSSWSHSDVCTHFQFDIILTVHAVEQGRKRRKEWKFLARLQTISNCSAVIASMSLGVARADVSFNLISWGSLAFGSLTCPLLTALNLFFYQLNINLLLPSSSSVVRLFSK